MAKVLTFSRTFPACHPKAGHPTYFVEKFWASVMQSQNQSDEVLTPISEYIYDVGAKMGYDYVDTAISVIESVSPKHHTIRSGHRFKKGDYFSPRVWSGKPYNSPQITIAPDTLITDVWDFEINGSEFRINEDIYDGMNMNFLDTISKNDGLDRRDLLDWFKYPKPFKGQIICWNENIKY